VFELAFEHDEAEDFCSDEDGNMGDSNCNQPYYSYVCTERSFLNCFNLVRYITVTISTKEFDQHIKSLQNLSNTCQNVLNLQNRTHMTDKLNGTLKLRRSERGRTGVQQN
jgi:hypothetical protein